MYLLDTNVCIDLMAGRRQVVERMADLGPIHVYLSAITIAELSYGAARSARPGYETSKIEQLLAHFRVLTVDVTVAREYGLLKADLASRGQLLEDNDLYIAATALARGLTLVTHDNGFDRIQGLPIEDWLR